MELNPGTMFDIRGYDVLATIDHVENGGRIYVLTNNSTHFLLASQMQDTFDPGMATFVQAFRYAGAVPNGSPAGTLHSAYRDALTGALGLALF